MLLPQPSTVIYPESDGKPMAETDVHRNLIVNMGALLRAAFPQAYVSGNICLYYEEGNPKRMIFPDALLCCSQAPAEKRIYLAWEEKAQLDLVMEFSSKSTHREDHNKKKRIYEQTLQVPYYVIFNPHVIYLNVFELKEGRYQQLETNEQGLVWLSDLKIHIGVEQANSLRLYDAEGQRILDKAEAEARRAEAEAQRANAEAQRANAEKQQKEAEAQRANTEAQRADAEKQQKEAALQKVQDEQREKETFMKREEAERTQKEEALQEQERLKAMLLAAGIDPEKAI